MCMKMKLKILNGHDCPEIKLRENENRNTCLLHEQNENVNIQWA